MSRTGRVLVVLGTRPEAIKLAPVVRALRAEPGLAVRTCTTGQHRSLLDQGLASGGLVADRALALMEEGQGLAATLGRVLQALAPVVDTEAPDLVLVQGDTTSTLAGALAGFHAEVPVAHVEAGLRTGRLDAPFPEEAHRRLVTTLSTWHYAPTARDAAALHAEGVPPEAVEVVGNPGLDALFATRDAALALPWADGSDVLGAALPALTDDDARVALVTVHRRENHPHLARVARAIRALTTVHPAVHVVIPVHPNPTVTRALHGALADVARVHLVAPLPHPWLVRVLARADVVVTDSGGVQEEAPALGTPVVLLREVSARREGLDTPALTWVGTDAEKIVEACRPALTRSVARPAPSSPYGDGRTGPRIAAHLGGRWRSEGGFRRAR